MNRKLETLLEICCPIVMARRAAKRRKSEAAKNKTQSQRQEFIVQNVRKNERRRYSDAWEW